MSSFASENYGTDALFKTSVASNAKSLSEAQLNSFRSYLPTVNDDYWLSDTSSKHGFDLIGVQGKDNTSLEINKQLIGKTPDGSVFGNEIVKFGSFDFSAMYSLKDFTQPSGTYLWSLDAESKIYMRDYFVLNSNVASSGVMRYGDDVWNNPFLKDDPSSGYYKSTYAGDRFLVVVTGKVTVVDGSVFIKQLKTGDTINAGDILFYPTRVGIADKDPTHFRRAYDGCPNMYFRASGNWKVGQPLERNSVVQGLYSGVEYEQTFKGLEYEGGLYAVRPVFDFTSSNVAFAREKTSEATLSTSSAFGNAPSSFVNNGDSKKAVVKSSDTSISSSINDSKISTDNSANGHANVTYSNNTIKVPYGAKTLTLNANAFSTSNANYISGLADSSSTQKYAVLGKTGQDITIELASILNNTQVGSSATVSFYAEQANEAGTSDVISATPVTLQIEVVEGSEQTIKYDNGGGTGSLPANAKVRAGKSYALADGSGLSKDGNLFSCWQLTYTPYGETDEVTRLVKSNEAIIVPDTTTGTIAATAMYCGVSAAKKTETPSSVVTVTWDSNAPSGFTATFANASGSGVSFNDSKSIRYDKIKIANSSIIVPGAPTLNTNTWIFDGWYTQASGGDKVTGSVSPSTNTTYYAHWMNGYTVTYDATGGPGAQNSGIFSNNVTTLVEIVMPGNKLKGPKIEMTDAIPVPNDENNDGLFFDGWYTEPNGNGDKAIFNSTSVTSNTTYYANYLSNTFLAPTTTNANPRTLSGKIGIGTVNSVAKSIAKGGKNPDTNIYSATNDNYHLYTLLKDSSGNFLDADQTDNWLEFRIVHVGQHNSDDTGLTFQATHMLPDAYRMNSLNSNTGGWEACSLKLEMNEGEIFSSLDSYLTNLAVNVAKPSAKGKFWLASYSELTGGSSRYIASDGDQFDYWKGKGITSSGTNSRLAIKGCRSGNTVNSINSEGVWWERSINTSSTLNFLTVTSEGKADQTGIVGFNYGVVPCFSL